MAKVDIDSVETQMASVGINQKERELVIAKLKQEIEQLKADKQNQPKVQKYKYIVANTKVPVGTPVTEIPMVVVEAEDEVSPDDIIDEIKKSGKQANENVKRFKKDPLKSVFDIIERCPAKYFKERKIRIIAKTLCQVLKTDNEL